MQISKLKLGMCAVTLCCSVASVQASNDTPAQAAARAALYQRMQQADGITNPPASMAPLPVAMQNPTTPGPATPATPASPVADANDTPAQATARAALMKRMQMADAAGGQPIVINSHGAMPPENTATMTPDQLKAIADAASKANAEKAAAEQTEAEKKATAEQAATQAKQAKEAQDAAMAASYPGKEMGFQPPQIPASPISPGKQAKLDNLLIEYRANEISPEEYHRERAAILAQP
jgi:hypothetical protein